MGVGRGMDDDSQTSHESHAYPQIRAMVETSHDSGQRRDDRCRVLVGNQDTDQKERVGGSLAVGWRVRESAQRADEYGRCEEKVGMDYGGPQLVYGASGRNPQDLEPQRSFQSLHA